MKSKTFTMTQKLKTEILDCCERIISSKTDWYIKNDKTLRSVIQKIENEGTDEMTREEKVCLSEYLYHRYYEGKVVAYLYFVGQIERGRLRLPLKYHWTRNSNELKCLLKAAGPCTYSNTV